MPARAPDGPIVNTKLQPPTQRRDLLHRDDLAAEISCHLDKRLILVSAPAGYGKTSVLAQLYRELAVQTRHAAWISLDLYDNDIVRLVAHLVEAIERAGLALRRGVNGLLNAEVSTHHGLDSGPVPQALTAELLNEFALLNVDLFVFLDDFHVIQQAAVRDLVTALLQAPLPRLHLVIATREQPALPLARLRADDQLHELDSARLAFSAEEIDGFLRLSDAPALTRAQTASLRARTEGWPASLQMASIALRDSGDVDEFLARFSGADRGIGDFLVEEVLDRQPPEIQHFLLATSILRRFNCALADAVLGQAGSYALIDRLEAANLFIFSLDRDRSWYRYHHLFGELLRRRLKDRDPELAAACHRRACDWLAANDYVPEAIDHAFAIDDLALAGSIVDAASPALFANAQTATLQAYAARLPPEILKRLPRLQLELVWENIIRWRFDAVRTTLAEIAALIDDNPASLDPAEIASLGMKRAHRGFMLGFFTDHVAAAEPAAHAWSRAYGARDAFMSASIAVAVMVCRRETYRCDLTHAQVDALRAQFLHARARYGTVFLDTVAGSILFMRGELDLAEQAYAEARDTADRMQGEKSLLAVMPGAQLAQLLYELDRRDEAQALIDEIRVHPLEFGLTDSVIARQVTTARLARARGDSAAAHRALDVATHLGDRFELPRLHAHILAERVPLLIADGAIREAERCLQDPRVALDPEALMPAGKIDSIKECLALSLARVDLETGRTTRAIRLLRRWYAWTADRHCARPSLRIALLLARLHLRDGDRLAARRCLLDALKLGSRGGFIRSIIDEGEEVTQLVDEIAASIEPGLRDYVHQLRRAAGRLVETIPAPRLPLTACLADRELDIIRLTAGNMVSHEIADALGLTEATVKWYWQRIFEKLGVRKRALAVRAARGHGLIG